MAAADALDGLVGDDKLSEEHIVPSPFDERAVPAVARAVQDAAREIGVRLVATRRHTGSVDKEHIAAGADGVLQYVDDFVCTCGDDKRAAADELREEARRILEAGTDDWCPGTVVDRDYVSAAVGWLEQHHCHIAEILTDQWSLVRVVEQRWNAVGWRR